MSEDYVTAKIHEALKATGGDKKDAQKLLVTWAVRDQVLLLGLAKPHLKAIVSARIDQAARGNKKDEEAGDFKKNIDSIISDQSKGEKRRAVKVPPPKSSIRQASVMHQLAAAFKKKK